MREMIIKFIRFYKYNSSRIWLSGHPILYTNCKYHPTCSEYTIQAINKYGIAQGVKKGILRILRCNPLSKGGVDLP